ncbi:hypothetical protein BDW71DRAFT_213267 [Aspergillus fruticulosus]
MAPSLEYVGLVEDSRQAAPKATGQESLDDSLSEPIAIVGLSLKFPQEATSPEAFWNMLVEKRCAMTEVPSDRYNIDAFHGTDTSRTDQVRPRGGHFIKEDLSLFDAPFFSITSAEAASMDVQQRQLLECVYRALENAGMPLEKVDGSNTSVYTGSFADDYRLMTMRDHNSLPRYAATGSSISILANRISWFYNLHGPSLQLDTACSSSLVALDMACQGLTLGESYMSIVAGSNTIFGMDTSLILSNMNFLSPDSRCYSFDHRGNGYARGEGFGVLVLKRVSDALRDGDTIRAVIRSTGSNSDGRTPGIAQPSGEAQEKLIKETYAKAYLDLGATRFFEAHGTGTAVGDPIEANAIGAAFSQYRSPDEPLYVGAVKSNVGHLEGTSGVAGVIKAVLALEKGVIPPNTNFEKINPRIDAPALNIAFPTQAIPWPCQGLRRASVNSFGFGGSNAHAVLDDAYNFLKIRGLAGIHNTVSIPPTPSQLNGSSSAQNEDKATECATSHPALLVWSAADEGGVKRLSDAYNAHFKQLKLRSDYISDLAYTLSERRSILPWRSYAVCSSLEDGVSLAPGVRSSRNLGIGFVFTGQGAQFAGMGRELLEYPVFKNTLLRAQLYLYEHGCEWSLMDELLKDKSASRVNRPDISQPLCTGLQIALIELLRTFDITPKAVVGHSSGEIAAAYCIGALSLRSAMKVAFLRGKLAAQIATNAESKGAMMATGLSEAQATSYIEKVSARYGRTGIVVACVNSPTSMTISGDEEQIDFLHRLLEKDSIFARKLQVDVAYHSPHMQQIADEYARQMGQLELGRPLPGCTVMVSSVTTMPVNDLQMICDANYWVSNLVSPVRFSDAVARLISTGAKGGRKKLGGSQVTKQQAVTVYDLLELGPHSALAGPVKEILKTEARGQDVRYGSCLTRNVPALESTMAAAGRLWCLGYLVNVVAVNNFKTGKMLHRRSLTDLPEYPFDHSQAYWHESRISKEYRLRKHPHLDLLGTPVSDWNPLEARWTKFIRASETPWVGDHVVSGATLYPAAGMLVMAIEGTRQLVQDSTTAPIKGYRVTEATFQRALGVDTETQQGTESQLYIRSNQDAIGKQTGQFEFRICTMESGQWGENCRGLIQVEYEDPESNNINGELESTETANALAELWSQRVRACTETVEAPVVYEHFNKMGLQFGPTFQTLERVSYSTDGQVVAQVKTFNWESHRQEHLIHPTTLDAFIQVLLVGLTRGASELIPTTVPTRVTNLWLSSSGLAHPEVTSLHATSRQLSKGVRQTESSFVVFDQDGNLRASVAVLETTNVDRQHTAAEEDTNLRQLCYHMDWKPDIDLLPPARGREYFGSGKPVDTQTADFYEKLACFQFLAISHTLPQLDPKRINPSRIKYIDWMKLQLERFDKSQTLHGRPEWRTKVGDFDYYNSQAQQLENYSSEGRFYVEVARNLLPILHGEIDPLQVLFSGELVKQYYLEINTRLSGVFARLLDLMAHKNPTLKALEVGAGTGGTTVNVIRPLFAGSGIQSSTDTSTPRCTRYDFTDTSASFFEKAQEDFAAYSSRMRYSTLDIEQDPQQQGFERGSYDIVVAANVLHATRNMDVTLRNVHSLLKPGGKLILLEQTGDFARGGFAFGLLPGWWLSEDEYRSWGPTMPASQWDCVLKGNAFSGTDFVLNDYESETCQELSIIVSTAQASANPQLTSLSPGHGISLVTLKDSESQLALARRLQEEVSGQFGLACQIHDLGVASDALSDTLCVFLVELDSALLHSMDRATFEQLQSRLLAAKELIWVTGGGGTSWETPEYQVVDGLLRTLRTENAMLKAVTLALSPSRTEAENVGLIQQVMYNVMTSGTTELEVEYREQQGILYTNRVVEAKHMNDHISISTKPQHSVVQPFGGAGVPPLALNINTPGLLDTLRFVEDEAPSQPLKPNEVEISVRAVGVNFMDLLTALGRINQVEIGGECAGIVTRVGSDTGTDLQPGDRVAAVAFDCFKTYARSDARTAIKIPDNLAFTEAAALPVTYTTAHYALIVAGRLQKTDKVLIHAAAGGTGQSAIQIAKHVGAEVFATVGSPDKKQLLMDKYGILEDHIFYSRDTSFAQGIMRMTQDRGVDVVLNSLAGEGLYSSWACMASFGRFVEIGKRDIHSHSRLNMFYFAKNVSFTAVDVFGMTKERPALVRASFAAAMDLVAAGHAKAPYPVQIYPVSQIETAFRHMQSGKSMGKLVIEMKKEDHVLTVLQPKPANILDPNATYLIAGGFGGIARRTARWMADRGALHLLLLGRSGPKSDHARLLLEELESRNVQVYAPPCNVASEADLATVLSECAKSMPPIKGCIQGAMVLKDAMLDRMTYDEWSQALLPKVAGSRNLDRLLPSGLDFFIMLSSVVGIHGSAGQANYAAGGTYQDALARARINRGERATVLDLGWMVSDGIIAESAFLTKTFETAGLMMPIDSAEYLSLLDYHCNPSNTSSIDAQVCQLIVGLETPAGLTAKGADIPSLLQRSTFRFMHAMGLNEAGGDDGSADAINPATRSWSAAFASAATLTAAREVVVEGLAHKLARALSVRPSEIDTARPLHSYGVDSLLAVELRSWIAKEFAADVAVFEIMGGTNFAAVASAVIGKSRNAQKGWEES